MSGDIHTCSYQCDRPACIRAQRDELVAKLDAVTKDANALRAFAQAVMEDWNEGDLDGGTRQDLAEKHGILKSVEMFKPCGENCGCTEFYDSDDFDVGMLCYRHTSLLTGDPASDERIAALTDQGRAGEGAGG